MSGRENPLGCRSLKIVPGAALVSVSCPSKSPLDQLAGLAEREVASAADPVQPESALVARLSTVPDLRRRRGRRHSLAMVMSRRATGGQNVDIESHQGESIPGT